MVGVCENGNKSLGSFDDGKVVDKLCLSTFSGLQSTTDRNINVQKKKKTGDVHTDDPIRVHHSSDG
jgi:hypothetical protein